MHLAEILAIWRAGSPPLTPLRRSAEPPDDSRRRRGDARPDFPDAAQRALGNAQLRRNVRHATDVIRGKRALVVGEIDDWQALREAGPADQGARPRAISTPT